MLSSIFESLLGSDRYERYDGINNILVISTTEYEVKVTSTYIKLDKVQFNMNLVDPHHGIPFNRELVASIDYHTFLEGDKDEVFGITKDDVNAILNHYRSVQ
jgi:hypothetical protein